MKGMRRNQKPQKQLTLDKLPAQQQSAQPPEEKKILITALAAQTGIDELTLDVSFKLKPSKGVFNKIKADLSFDNQPLQPVLIRIPQGPLALDELEYGWVLDMTGIAEGKYAVKVEMYEVWGSERLGGTEGELLVDYVPQTRQSRLVKVPSVKSVAGGDLAVASKTENEIYREIKDSLEREQKSERDSW